MVKTDRSNWYVNMCNPKFLPLLRFSVTLDFQYSSILYSSVFLAEPVFNSVFFYSVLYCILFFLGLTTSDSQLYAFEEAENNSFSSRYDITSLFLSTHSLLLALSIYHSYLYLYIIYFYFIYISSINLFVCRRFREDENNSFSSDDFTIETITSNQNTGRISKTNYSVQMKDI